jgi:hypothetical protein
MCHAGAGYDLTEHARGDVEQPYDPESSGHEARRACERMSQVTHAGHHDASLMIEADLALDLPEKVGDVVTRPSGAVSPEVREILADLGGVDSTFTSELRRRHRRHRPEREVTEHSLVEGKTNDCRLWYSPSETLNHVARS